jgi:2-polyprenyl-6-hydroxyphenyl methylase / 3-demethylubiquinone-9 3-methyltransferase
MESISIAQKHANQNNLDIKYYHGYGENLPFGSNYFSIILCCDVLEHVSDLKKVISEISRVLVPGGILFFDTVNRTFVGKMIIKATQEWESSSFMEPNVHVWNMFIKPRELIELLKNNNLIYKEIKGMSLGINFIYAYFALRKCKKGKMNFQQLGKKLNLQISNKKSGQYIGYAIKKS